jgi:ferrous iron transport protein A
MNLSNGNTNTQYDIASITTHDEGMKDFLFTLGCYPGEKITLISQVSSSYVINVKDARYSIDRDLADSIEIVESGYEYEPKAI